MNLRKILKFLFALGCISVILTFIDLSALGTLFIKLDFVAVLLLLAISLVMVLVSAVKWKIFIDYLGSKTSLLKLYGLYLVGYYCNLLLPSYVGGDVVRSYYVGKTVGQHEAAAATILERYTGLLAMILLGVISSFFSDLITVGMRWWIVSIAVLFAIGTWIALSPFLIHVIEKTWFVNKFSSPIKKLASAFKLAARNPRIIGESLFLSFMFHVLTVVNTVACGYAIGWYDISFVGLSVVLPAILIIIAIPISPQGIGIQEGAFIYFLTQLGASPEQAVGISLILRAKSYVLALMGGVIYHIGGTYLGPMKDIEARNP